MVVFLNHAYNIDLFWLHNCEASGFFGNHVQGLRQVYSITAVAKKTFPCDFKGSANSSSEMLMSHLPRFGSRFLHLSLRSLKMWLLCVLVGWCWICLSSPLMAGLLDGFCQSFLFLGREVREVLVNHREASPEILPCLNGLFLPPVSLCCWFHSL